MTYELNTDYLAEAAQAHIEEQELQDIEMCFCQICGDDYVYSIVHGDGHCCEDCKQTKY